MKDRLYRFVQDERPLLAGRYTGGFSLSAGTISHYYDFLHIVLRRFEQDSQAYHAAHQAFQATLPPGYTPFNTFTPPQQQLFSQSSSAMTAVQLDVESFYIFAKILLDKIAAFLEYYFQPGNITGSHHTFFKKIERWAHDRTIGLPDGFIPLGLKLQTIVSDFRDKTLVHDKSPHTSRGLSWDGTGQLRLSTNRIVVAPRDMPFEEILERMRPAQTRPLHELMHDINTYLELVLQLIESNRDKTALKEASAS